MVMNYNGMYVLYCRIDPVTFGRTESAIPWVYCFNNYAYYYEVNMHSLCVLGAINLEKQVDILLSKNHALQILYLKHIKLHKIPWIESHKNLISIK